MKRTFFVIAAWIGIAAAAMAADATVTIKGIVTATNAEQRTITLRDDETRTRRTYFINDQSRMSSKGQPIQLSGIRRGHAVTLTYRPTDTGRVIETARIPGDVVDVPPIASVGASVVAGTITGVRPSLGTITIREDRSRRRLTLKVPDGARIVKAGREVGLGRLRNGDIIEARYRMTPEGPVLLATQNVVVTAPTAVTSVAAAPAPTAVALPKTASNDYLLLLLGLGAMVIGGLMRVGLLRKVRV